MAKRSSSSTQQTSASTPKQAANPVQAQLQALLKQQKYRQALDELKKLKRTHPELEFSPSEAEIWVMRGKQEFQKQEFKQAENSFRSALERGLAGETHYWIARCLLELNRLDTALDLIRSAFEDKTLPKDYGICYLKLLMLKGDTATVEQLITKQSKRFWAAQLHWARGVLALKAGDRETALTSFQKIKHPLTPGDHPMAWTVYLHQQLGHWELAKNSLRLGSTPFSTLGNKPSFLEQPIFQRLALWQKAKSAIPPLALSDLRQCDPSLREALTALTVLQLLDQSEPHNAAHAFLNLGRSPRLPELAALRSTLLILAGQQALQQGEPNCTVTFWQPLVAESPLNPQLAVNLVQVLDATEDYQDRQRLLTRLLKWVEQEAKKNPDAWPEQRLKRTLAQGHCFLADTWMALNRDRAALGALQQAERICPDSPEVIGRKGLLEAAEEAYEAAIPLLTQALEQGSHYQEIYSVLLLCWDELDNPEAKLEARRRFGKPFGDLNPEADVRLPAWIDALVTHRYSFFKHLVEGKERPDPPLRACQIFIDAVQSPPNSGGRVSLNQAQATQKWEELLATLSEAQKVPTLQAIAIVTHLFAKREKGIAGLISRYMVQLGELGGESPAARLAHLVVLTVKESNTKRLEFPLRFYLDSSPQPGNALAQVQLQVRQFAQTSLLRSFIDEALRQEPQNPLLLLAKATTYPPYSKSYEDLKQQGFELARRLQDAKALQAFREEQAFLQSQETQEIMPDPEAFDDLDPQDMDTLLEAMIRRMAGNQIPKAELERILPELKQQFFSTLPDNFDQDNFDDEDDLDFPFGGFSGLPRKRKRDFRQL